MTQPPTQPAPQEPTPLNATTPPPISTPQPHPQYAPQQQQRPPVVVQQDMSGVSAALSELGQRLGAIPEQIVNSLKEGAAHAVPQSPPAATPPGQTAPAPQPIPAAGQSTADSNLAASGRQPSRFASWWFNGGRKS